MLFRIAVVFLVVATATQVLGGLRVSGRNILDAKGKPFIMRGINYPHTWYKTNAAEAIPAIAATGANIVRIVLSDGGVWVKDDANSVARVLDLCRQHRMVAMVEVHDTTGSFDAGTLQAAVNYWISLAGVLKGREDYVIINIANEWTPSSQVNIWQAGYSAVLPALRKAGLTHLLAIDAAGFGQGASSVVQQGQAVFNADPQRNVIFALHMYEVIAPTARIVKETFDAVERTGLPFFVGEFSDAQGGKAVAYQAIMSYCQQLHVGYIAWYYNDITSVEDGVIHDLVAPWKPDQVILMNNRGEAATVNRIVSWFGNGPATSNMDMAYGPSGNLTRLGNILVNGRNGIRQTSRLANM